MSVADTHNGLPWVRKFCPEGIDPWSTVEWGTRDCTISDSKGGIVFQQLGVLAPVEWSDTAVNIAASKYFRGHLGEEGRECSVRQMIERVAHTISAWGYVDNYFDCYESSRDFYADMVWLLLHQCFAFNSPVWFNLGVDAQPQVSACFINNAEDTMDSIMELAATEARLFKGGSGAGVNLSKIRGSTEKLTGGGLASGPVSFMRGFDSFAGVVKSGGKTRRAAKIVILDADHPDIEEFISCKMVEEKKAHALIAAGYDGAFNAKGGAYDSIYFQNANHSVRVSDSFMRAACLMGSSWNLVERTTGNVCSTVSPQMLLEQMAEAAWFCGDPGLQFDTTINEWHTCPESGRIEASNPCSEYMHISDSACNLASLNLMKFRKEGVLGFDHEKFTTACQLIIIAQDILVDRASYPTEKIGENARNFRQLGLGYANLGSLLMVSGLGYGSADGRELAASITSAMHCAAYTMSAKLAQVKGPFAGYVKNRNAMLGVISKHWNAALDAHQPAVLQRMWELCYTEGHKHGYRNSQVTVLAPTGTIGMLMDCSTTGIEPNIALVSYKNLVGGGFMRLANDGVREALVALGYVPDLVDAIVKHVEEYGHVEGAGLEEAHLEVFDCALRSASGQRVLSPEAHILMMAAVQPFLSGAISKTVNCPNNYTVEDIKALYISAWKLGLKSIAVYRDGCKLSQPLNTKKKEVSDVTEAAPAEPKYTPAGPIMAVQLGAIRRRLPAERQAINHKFEIGGHEGYVNVGLYPDGTPGEIFLTMSKEGSTISGLMDAFATSISLGLQYGVPLATLIEKFRHTRFEPSGFTGHSEIHSASSLIDYIFHWLDLRFGAGAVPARDAHLSRDYVSLLYHGAPVAYRPEGSDAPFCSSCGSMMVRSGSCYRCTNCGGTSGCS